MHPDYLDYAVKTKIRGRAQWHDIKFLLRKLLSCDVSAVYCQRIVDGTWNGWVVEFNCDVDLSQVQSNVYGVCVLGERAFYVEVNNG